MKKGFQDVVRTLYPDPVTHPFLTVDVLRKESENNPSERIDFMYASKAHFKAVSSKSILCPFSDHLPVVSTLEIKSKKHLFQ
jgi:exonuclease III